MIRNDDMTPELIAEVKQWLDQLLNTEGEDRRNAAKELSRLGVWSRGSVRTRGSLTEAARNRLPEPATLKTVVQALKDSGKDVRCQVASALGEWGGQDAASALSELLRSEKDEEVQLYCVTALRTIGGPTAVEALLGIVGNGTEAVRDAVISAIEELATGGKIEDTESQMPQPSSALNFDAKRSVRTRGTVRARGGRARKDSGLVDNVSSALQDIRDNEDEKKYLRLRADEALGYLVR